MGEQLDDKIAELLALLNAPDGQVLDILRDAEIAARSEEQAPAQVLQDQSPEDQPLPDQCGSDESQSTQQIAAPEETRFAKYVAAIMQARKA